MRQPLQRYRIDDTGRLEIVDPGFEDLDLLCTLDPTFRVRQEPLPGFTAPRLQRTRQYGTGVTEAEARKMPDAELWACHTGALARMQQHGVTPATSGEATLLDVKVLLAQRLLAPCRLCAHRCGVNRMAGELGACQLGPDAAVAEHFVHIGEEAPINPSLVLNLAGCGLRCKGCQQHLLLDPKGGGRSPLEPALWDGFDTQRARSLSFVGGNPDESLPSILSFLTSAPADWALPIVWNSHAYSTPEVLTLLDGLIDAYVPDYKHASEPCARRYTRAPHYPKVALQAIACMLEQGVPVIVRVLVLPGHVGCCHLPAIDALAELPRRYLLVSVRDQYAPDYRVSEADGSLARRPTSDECNSVRTLLHALGLPLVL